MTTVRLGNPAPHEILAADVARARDVAGEPWRDGYVRVVRSDLGETVTEVSIPAGTSVLDALAEVRDLWAWHSAGAPSYVESDNATLAGLLGEHYGAQVRPLPGTEV